MRSPSYFAALLQTLYFYYSKVHVCFLQHFELDQRGHRVATLVAEYRAEEYSSAVVPYVALKEVAMECDLPESDRELNFPDVICARRF